MPLEFELIIRDFPVLPGGKRARLCRALAGWRRPCLAFLGVLFVGLVAQAQSNDYGGSAPIPAPLPSPIFRPPPSPRSVYLPALPPALDQILERPPRILREINLDLGIALEDCANEPFYPQFAYRLRYEPLTPREQRALAGYLGRKFALEREIRAQLEQTDNAAEASRSSNLAALAEEQSGALAALEREADELRRRLGEPEHAWGALRQWRLGGERLSGGYRRSDTREEIAGVMRAAAYFQSGLSARQRELLRFIAAEILVADNPDVATDRAADQAYVQFLPAPARVALPDDLPLELDRKIARFQTAMSDLKKEIYDAVYEQDSAWFNPTRHIALASLANREAAAFSALEQFAEEIRRDLVPFLSGPRPVPRSPLPPILTERIAALMRDRQALQGDTAQKVLGLKANLKDFSLQVTYRFERSRLVCRVWRIGRMSGKPGSDPALRRAEQDLDRIVDNYNLTYQELGARGDAIRKAISDLPGFGDPAVAYRALSETTRQVVIRQDDDAYRDYRWAVLSPGLSPAQRRVMFDAAIRKLDLPRPIAEIQPRERADEWR